MGMWADRLKTLQEQLGKTPDEMAAMLGITVRTLGEFTRPEGREPSAPIQRLVAMFEDELKAPRQATEKIPPKLNLVIIHSDFKPDGNENVIAMIDAMNKAGSENDGTGDKAVNKVELEFHYIAVDPARDMQSALSVLQNKRVTPHFFIGEQALSDADASNAQMQQCCYFSAITVWLASIAKQKGIGYITLAADANRFWPIAKELKELAEVDVSFIQGREKWRIEQDRVEALGNLGINVITQSQHQGRIYSLKERTPGAGISYGFLEYVQREGEEWVSRGDNKVFFSWNHMKKIKGTNIAERNISDLGIGDIVSFRIGMNDKGACATDVALIAKSEHASTGADSELLEIIKDAVQDCSDEDGWALISSIGSRLSIQHPDYREKIKAQGHDKVVDIFKDHKDAFEYKPSGNGTKYSAACVRLK